MTLIASHRGGYTSLARKHPACLFRNVQNSTSISSSSTCIETRDNKLVVHHDALIDRMTDGKGAIADFSL